MNIMKYVPDYEFQIQMYINSSTAGPKQMQLCSIHSTWVMSQIKMKLKRELQWLQDYRLETDKYSKEREKLVC
jgi:hypothetical protein